VQGLNLQCPISDFFQQLSSWRKKKRRREGRRSILRDAKG
jgi:capsule polysaccharide modification protein KpsS